MSQQPPPSSKFEPNRDWPGEPRGYPLQGFPSEALAQSSDDEPTRIHHRAPAPMSRRTAIIAALVVVAILVALIVIAMNLG